jgi:hypothetical protein
MFTEIQLTSERLERSPSVVEMTTVVCLETLSQVRAAIARATAINSLILERRKGDAPILEANGHRGDGQFLTAGAVGRHLEVPLVFQGRVRILSGEPHPPDGLFAPWTLHV